MPTAQHFIIAPSWAGVAQVLAEVAANGTTSEGRAAAQTELNRMAALADRWASWAREGA